MVDRRRRDLLALTLVAVGLRLPAILSSRHLSFDDGVYGATTVAMRDGARPYRDVFSSQGPLHHPLLFAADLVGFRTSAAPRLLSLAAGVAITLGTYLAARLVADRRAGLVAGLLATTSGSVLFVTTGITGDGPAIAFAVLAVVAALAARTHEGPARPLAAGLLIGAACSVKLLAAPVVVPVGLLLLARGRVRQTVAAATVAVAVPLALAALWGYSRVWSQSIVYHREARRFSVGETAWRIVTTLVERDPFVVVTALVVVVLALAARGRWAPPSRPLPTRPGFLFGAWLVVQTAFLLIESAMWRPHVSQLIVPLCLLACLRLPSWRALAVAWLVAAPIWVVNVTGIVFPGGYRGGDADLAAALRALPDDAVVVTDEPGFAWRTDRRVPDALVDLSAKQLDQGRITRADILDAARDDATCAVLITSDERFGQYPDLASRLRGDGYRTLLRDGDRRLLVRDCP